MNDIRKIGRAENQSFYNQKRRYSRLDKGEESTGDFQRELRKCLEYELANNQELAPQQRENVTLAIRSLHYKNLCGNII
jgi:hypothetical protein